MAAASASTTALKQRVNEILQCPVCLEQFTQPKLLPCAHSFCLQCLQSVCSDFQPWLPVPCPICRKQFVVPDSGLQGLPPNVIVQGLIDVKQRLCRKPAMSVVHTLPGEDRVVGLAMLNGELYVLRQSTQNQISVYSAAADSTSTTEHYLLRQFSVAGLASNCNNDLTASARTNCLYVSDWRNKRLLKSGTDGLVETRWGLPYNPYAMSLTPNDKLLITSWDSRKLLEISGKRFRKMDLQSDLDKLCHAVQLTSQIFVVSHGRWDNYENLHRVCLVGQDGKVLLSYGHLSGSDGLHLDLPRHLAVDRDNFVIVADYYNSRLAVLSPSLQLVRHVPLPSKPWRLYLDHVTRRLYVGYYDAGDVSVIQV